VERASTPREEYAVVRLWYPLLPYMLSILHQKSNTSSIPKKASQLCLDMEVYKYVLAIDTSLSRKS
jgi:hypothetical protein